MMTAMARKRSRPKRTHAEGECAMGAVHADDSVEACVGGRLTR
jgi:hypothetical protein